MIRSTIRGRLKLTYLGATGITLAQRRCIKGVKRPSRRVSSRFGNLLEMCALALPNGAPSVGLPLSLQIVCRGYDEAMALRIGHAYQQATDLHLQAPPT